MHLVFFAFERIDLSDYYLRLCTRVSDFFNHGYGTGSGGFGERSFHDDCRLL